MTPKNVPHDSIRPPSAIREGRTNVRPASSTKHGFNGVGPWHESSVLKVINIVAAMALVIAMVGQIGRSALPAVAAEPVVPSNVPHYFGPWPNWANSPLTTPDIAVEFVGDGTGAAATATVGGDGSVTDLTLTDPGSGYTTPPTVTFTGAGTDAAATATIATSGAVTGVSIDTPGSGYSAPTVTFTGGEGPGVPVQIGNAVDGDRTYATDYPNVSSPEPVLVVVPDAALPAGTLTEFLTWNQADQGSSPYPSAGKTFVGYVLRPTGTTDEYSVVFASDMLTVPPLTGTDSEQVSFPVSPGVAVEAGDVLAFYGSGIPLDAGGGTDVLSTTSSLVAPTAGDTLIMGSLDYPVVTRDRTYSFAATVLDSTSPGGPLTPAAGTVYGGVDAISLDDPGAGYTFPTVDIDYPDGPDGVQATAHVECVEADCNNNNDPVTIARIVVDNPGAGYSTAPGIVIRDGTQFDPIIGGTGAVGTATLNISSIVVDEPGDGYITAPTVTIDDPDGTGATATASVNTGAVTGLTLDAGGSGYLNVGIKKFEDELPLTCLPPACPTGANAKYLPVAVPTVKTYNDDQGTPIDADEYVIGLVQYRSKFHKDLPATLVRGYVQLWTPDLVDEGIAAGVPLANELLDGTEVDTGYTAVTPPQFLGPFISATKDRPVRIVFRNLLPTGADGDLFLPVDSTMMGSGTWVMDHGVTGNGTVEDEVRNPKCSTVNPKPIDCFKDNRGDPAPARRGHAVDQ